ncbi:hypothetical protein E0485_05090 [Paenibacillus albiflavus]|uniref:Uncharacterized protein n=1 Tax=Paenibacillus albiflavus TaxID=2545760 RepID=A0A4R4ELQ5_9BACL|nr:hypothetical protein [Paenibacillus albiflavus]TCZ79248.1 hypothetical protein E0485_05090 [Paenibacillus albiflavus]
MLKKVYALVLSLALLLTVVTPTNAASPNIDFNQISIESGLPVDKLKELWAKESTMTQEQLDEISYQQMASTLNISIEEVRKSFSDAEKLAPYMSIDDSGSLIFDSVAAQNANVVEKSVISALVQDLNTVKQNQQLFKACEGEQTYNDNILWEEALFNSCTANKLVGYLALASAALLIASEITATIAPPAAAVTRITSALIAAAAGVVSTAASNGCGIKIKRWLGIIPWSITSQCD